MPQHALEKFAERFNPDIAQGAGSALTPLSGDAGFRRYYRSGLSKTLIAVDSPPKKERNLAYVRASQLMRSLGVRVPRIYAVDFHAGYFLLEDMGDQLLQDRLTVDSADGLYGQALSALIKIQGCTQKPCFIPDYDRPYLLSELELFPSWFLRQALDIDLSADEQELIEQTFAILLAAASEQPQTLVHRDFHVRNLMCLDNDNIAVIDFQDAMWGPITYDLVSLGRDCYLRWSNARFENFVQQAHATLAAEDKLGATNLADFRRWFDLMGLQRHLKVLGIFIRLSLRDGKHGYLEDLPLVLRYTLEVAAKYDELAEFNIWMLERVIPQCQKQPWYSDWQAAGSDSELA